MELKNIFFLLLFRVLKIYDSIINHYFFQLVKSNFLKNKITEQIEKKELSYKNLQAIRYKNLYREICKFDGNRRIQIMTKLFEQNCKYLKQKKRIKIGFVVQSTQEWQCDEIYKYFCKDERFFSSIYIVNDPVTRRKNNEVGEFFKNKGYRIDYNVYNLFKGISNIDKCDILFYMYPYSINPEYLHFENRKLSQMVGLIPYGIMQTNRSINNNNTTYFYDMPIVSMSWKYYSSSPVEQNIIKQTAITKGYNAIFLGFPKIDSLINKTYEKRNNIWKTTNDTKYKIIWAPHFNMGEAMNGTFDKNYQWFYDFAKKRKDISWIVRPHPRMRFGVVRFGVFSDEKEYEEYINDWNNLENANVIEDGEYYDIFDSSDAIILDSISFVAEYYYTEKPLLILEQDKRRPMNELGEKLRENSYLAKGNEFDRIEKFIDEIIDTDPDKGKRIEIKNSLLDNRHEKNASKNIYENIINEIWD